MIEIRDVNACQILVVQCKLGIFAKIIDNYRGNQRV